MFNVYVLSSINFRKSYVGCTDDLTRRLKEHNSDKMAYTKHYKPWKIVHFEEFENLAIARKRESYLKTGAGRRFLKKIFNDLA
jgi:putative endonuclease